MCCRATLVHWGEEILLPICVQICENNLHIHTCECCNCEYYFHCNFVESVDQSHHFFPDWISTTIGWTAMKFIVHPVIHCWQKMNPFDFGDHLTTMWLMFLKYRWATWRLEIVNDLEIVEIAVFKVLLLLFSNSLTSRSVLHTTAIEMKMLTYFAWIFLGWYMNNIMWVVANSMAACAPKYCL